MEEKRYGRQRMTTLIDEDRAQWGFAALNVNDLLKRIAELEAQLAAAKPVLTAEERRHVEEARRCGWAYLHAETMIPAVDRLCPPTKEPPSDANIADAIEGGEFKWAIDALRAREVRNE